MQNTKAVAQLNANHWSDNQQQRHASENNFYSFKTQVT